VPVSGPSSCVKASHPPARPGCACLCPGLSPGVPAPSQSAPVALPQWYLRPGVLLSRGARRGDARRLRTERQERYCCSSSRA